MYCFTVCNGILVIRWGLTNYINGMLYKQHNGTTFVCSIMLLSTGKVACHRVTVVH